MTRPTNAEILANLRALIDSLPGEPMPWDEGLEQRMSQVAESYDDETGRHRALRARRDVA